MIDLNGYVYQCPSCESFASKPLDACMIVNCAGGKFIKVPTRKATTKHVKTVVVTETYISGDFMDHGWSPAQLSYRTIVDGENPTEISSNEGLVEFGCSKGRYARVTQLVQSLCHNLFGELAFNNKEQEDLVLVAMRKEDLDKLKSRTAAPGVVYASPNKKL